MQLHRRARALRNLASLLDGAADDARASTAAANGGERDGDADADVDEASSVATDDMEGAGAIKVGQRKITCTRWNNFAQCSTDI